MSTEDFEMVYKEIRQPITGVTFFLLPLRKGKINFVKLREKLEGNCDVEEFYEESIEKDIEEGEELYIPEVFTSTEHKKLVLQTSIDKAILTTSSLFGKATIDRPITLGYRGYRILVIATTEIHFLILRDKNTKKYYLVMLGSRNKSKNIIGTMNKFLEKIGLFAVKADLDPDKIDGIREELEGILIDTTLDKFPSPYIKLKRIIGRGFQNDESYRQDAMISSVHQHMFEFKTGAKSRPKVITLSEDALVRFYSSLTFQEYEWFLREKIFPNLRQIKKLPTAPLVGYSVPDDIFEVAEEED